MSDTDKLDQLITDVAGVRTDVAVMKSQMTTYAALEVRIRELERRVWAAVGIAGLLVAAIPILLRLIPT